MSLLQNMPLTKTQVVNLLKKAYGFTDKHGDFMQFDVTASDDVFTLTNSVQESFEFVYENACIDAGELVIHYVDGGMERLTILVEAQNVEELLN